MPKILGLITARGGSKGIPGKNIKELSGKPLIAYSIEAARNSGVIDRIVLSTDDAAIAEAANKYGAEVPFMRPNELAEDTTAHLPVLQHALTWLREHENYVPEYVLLLQPTAPLRQPSHIKEAAEIVQKHPDADSVISAVHVPELFHSAKTMILVNGQLRTLSGEPIYKRIPRRQDLRDEYTTAGLMILLFKTDLLFGSQPNFYGEKTLPYMMEERYVMDINEPGDWEKAEEALKELQNR